MILSRIALSLLSLLPMLTLHSHASADEPKTLTFYIGGYTSAEGSKGIQRATIDLSNGSFTEPVLAGEVKNPSFVAAHPTLPVIYSIMEIGEFDKQKSGGVAAFAIQDDGGLKQLNAQPTGGQGPCFVSVDPTGKYLFVANYSGGNVAAFSLTPDGAIGDQIGTDQHHGSGPNPKRQQRAFAHCFVPSPQGSFALSADLGCDRIFVYQFGDPAADSFKPAATPSVSTPAGSGPRHIAFHPTKPAVYVVTELNNTVLTFSWDATTAAMKQIGEVSTLPKDFSGSTTSAEVAVHPNGKFVYSSNRGHDSIAVFGVNDDLTLTPIAHTKTGGQQPRHFAIDPTGAYLVVANQKTDDIFSFKIDPATGTLSSTGHSIKLDAPSCIRFLPIQK